jgi:hypothetical protein
LQDNPLLVYAKEHLMENILEGRYVGDVADGQPAQKAEVSIPGGHSLSAVLLLNLEDRDPDACLNLLHLLLATELPHAGMLRVRAPLSAALQLAFLLDTLAAT